jgi:thiamine biosynthesis lipoprotein
MASSLHLVVVTDDAGAAPAGDLLRAAVDLLDGLEARWSRFVTTSDITRINRLGWAGGGGLVVDGSTIELLAAMVEGYRRTSGRFDPSQLLALLDAGYVASRVDPSAVSATPPAGAATGGGSILDVVLDRDTGRVDVPPGLALDPGGIGKGLAADLALDLLLRSGAAGAMVGIGGDLACAGRSIASDGWLVDVEWPEPSGRVLGRIAIDHGGVATSSVRSRRWLVDGVERHHQIDPATGSCSATDLHAVTVIAPSGWLAEVHATAALGSGRDGVVGYLDDHGLSGVAVPADGGAPLSTLDLAEVVAEPAEALR